MEKYDLVVVGAGISGLSSAFHFIEDNNDARVCVVEKSPTFAQGNTAKSDAAFRDLFTSDTNFKLASSSISFYKDVQRKGYNLGMHFNGYLFLLDRERIDSPAVSKLLRKTHSRLIGKEEISSLGIVTEPDPQVAKIMNLKDVSGGLVGENCGIMEPDLLASYYFGELEKRGVEFKFNTRVKRVNISANPRLDFPGEPFIWQDKIVSSVESATEEIKGDQFLLATDVWTEELLDPIGIDSFTHPKKVQVFQVQGNELAKMITRKVTGDEDIFPFTILPGPAIDVRPDPKSGSFWVSYSEGIGSAFSLEENPSADINYYSNNLFTVLREYVPAFNDSRVTASWAGYYSMNNMDGTYILEKSMNLSFITGSSGSGIMKADSAGRLAAALVSGKEKAKLFNGEEMNISDLGIRKRRVEREELII
ncbi:MAG: NAD(P)/FAD-dependent oxidoreductase [Thermoplasmata archaeon]